MKASKDIDLYIASYPQKTQVLLKKMRAVIYKAAPQATEAISYGVPTYKLNGNLVHFGGFKSHIGFFPTPSGIKHFQKELSAYKTSKGAVQFPIEKPIPVGLGACPSNRCSNLSITHNSCADRGAQPDIGETGQAAPHHDVPRRRIIGAREVSA